MFNYVMKLPDLDLPCHQVDQFNAAVTFNKLFTTFSSVFRLFY